ncbi:MAG: AbrB/MazE/SpoVT family DNA-binding domain-containing protein [Deltaproteobacteria bacterium]|nr:AbrB/MazE/SpoVT family DNA-binding domain-containing protein [Deltaproteobacteria bacterium]
MREHLIVSGRGQITLPASVRKRLRIKTGDVLILDDRESEIVLRPAAVVEVDMYSDEQIAEWDAEDRLEPADRERLAAKLTRAR